MKCLLDEFGNMAISICFILNLKDTFYRLKDINNYMAINKDIFVY
jgi:hypothetical protein